MSALSEKLAKARQVASDLRGKMMRDADALLAKGEKLDKKREEVFAAHQADLDTSAGELDALDRELDLFSNEPRPTPPTSGGVAGGGTDINWVRNDPKSVI